MNNVDNTRSQLSPPNNAKKEFAEENKNSDKKFQKFPAKAAWRVSAIYL